MAINIEIKPEDIDELIKDTLIQKGLGKSIADAVTSVLNKAYDNPIEKALQSYVGEIATELIKNKFAEQIKTAIASEIERRVTFELIDSTVQKAIRKVESAAESYY